MFPFAIMPMSAFTYVQTSSECPDRSASAIISPDFLRIAFWIALISGRLFAMSKHMSSSFRFPGTKVEDTLTVPLVIRS